MSLTRRNLLAMAAATSLSLALSCSAPGGALTVHIDHAWQGAPLPFNQLVLTNTADNELSVTRVAYLVSEVVLTGARGAENGFADQTAFIDAAAGRNEFLLNNLRPGHYTNISFRIGVPPSVNHQNPAIYLASDPLNPALNDLHWNWQGGYVFLALEGRYRRNDNQFGGYSYHLATDPINMHVILPVDILVESDATLNLRFDLARIFDAASLIRITDQAGANSTHSASNDPLAKLLAANATRAFSVRATQSNIAAAKPGSQPKEQGSHAVHGTPYAMEVPATFPRPAIPVDNPLTVEGVALGKKLFFDKRLSGNGAQSCASCHDPAAAFSDRGRALSIGIDGLEGKRNAMPLFNLAWQREFFWDGRAPSLRRQVLGPLQDSLEMHASLPDVVKTLGNDKECEEMFLQAFGSGGVTTERLSLAFEQYLSTLISADSKFDRAARGEAQFSGEEKRGLELFITEYDPAHGKLGADCFHCHGGFLFSDYAFKNNGLDLKPADLGRFLVTTNDADRGRFKTPSLRNVEVTGPYMHDGRFATLEEVVEHYNSGVKRSDTLDPNLAKHPDNGLGLSEQDKKALVAFLKTLTGEHFHAGQIRIAKYNETTKR